MLWIWIKVLFKTSQRFFVEILSRLTVKFFELKTRRPSVPRLKYINEDAFRSQRFHDLSPHRMPTASMSWQWFSHAVFACSLRVRRSRSDCAVGFWLLLHMPVQEVEWHAREGRPREDPQQFLHEQVLQVWVGSSNTPTEVGAPGLPFPKRVEFRVKICRCPLMLTAPCYK